MDGTSFCSKQPDRGILLIISGPSGVGKNTVLNKVLSAVDDISYSISATTRKPRPGEDHGVNYFFYDADNFQQLIENEELLEWAEFCSNKYGTPRRYVQEQLSAGRNVILDIDIQGAAQIRQTMSSAVKIFLLPPSWNALRQRIIARGAENEEEIEERLCAARAELLEIVNYDYVVCNDNLEDAVRQISAIITAEQARVARWLENHEPQELIPEAEDDHNGEQESNN